MAPKDSGIIDVGSSVNSVFAGSTRIIERPDDIEHLKRLAERPFPSVSDDKPAASAIPSAFQRTR